jgi:hypothetical protein
VPVGRGASCPSFERRRRRRPGSLRPGVSPKQKNRNARFGRSGGHSPSVRLSRSRRRKNPSCLESPARLAGRGVRVKRGLIRRVPELRREPDPSGGRHSRPAAGRQSCLPGSDYCRLRETASRGGLPIDRAIRNGAIGKDCALHLNLSAPNTAQPWRIRAPLRRFATRNDQRQRHDGKVSH